MYGHARPAQQATTSNQNNQKAWLANAYQELGKELGTEKLRVVGGYTLGKVIGEGTYGTVHICTHRLTSTRCAIKRIPKHLSSMTSLTREIHHHRRLHHPHICQLLEVLATESHIWLVTELCAGGELFDYLVEKGRLTEVEGRRIFGELCLAVGYMHERGVVHRDLKLENVLLDGECRVKLGDLGFVREWEAGRLLDTFCGTTGYASPEMLQGKKYTGAEVDVWSLGIILYCLLTGGLPFDDDDEDTMKALIIKGEYEDPEWLEPEPRSLIHTLLSLDPTQRPNVREILAHPWFTKCIYPSPPPSLPPSRAPSPSSFPSQLPTSPTIEEEIITFSSSRTLPTPVAEEPLAAVLPPLAAPGSEADTNTSFEWKDGESDHVRSGRTSPTTVSSGSHAPDDDEAAADDKPGGSPRPASPKPTLRRAGSEATIRKSSSDSSKAASLSSRVDLPGGPGEPIEEICEEDEDGPADPVAHQSDYAHAERDRLLKHLLPFAQHSKTPSRTKRRSVSSSLSGRLTPSTSTQQLSQLPHRGAVPYVNVDYLSLLSDIQQPEFTTDEEDEMLRALKAIGVDTGQLMHSVKTNACDTSGAFWWILWGKGVHQRRESLARRGSKTQAESDERALKTRAESAERGRRDRERTVRPPITRDHASAASAGVSPGTITRELELEPPPPPPPPPVRVERLPSDTSSIESSALSLRERLDSPLPPAPPKGEPTAELAQAVEDPSGSTTIHMGPINVEPPTPTLPSSRSMQTLQVDSLSPAGGMTASRSFPNLSDSGSHPSTPVDEGQASPMSSPSRSRRAEMGKTRSSSVSMLQTLAAGLSRKKSDDRGFVDEVERRASVSPAPPVLPIKASKSPPTPRVELLNLGKMPPFDERRPSSATSASTATEVASSSRRRGSQPGDSLKSDDASSDYSDVVKSPTSAKGSQGKAGLFSTFRTWLGADPKKRNGKQRAAMPQLTPRTSGGSNPSSASAHRSASRQSLERRPKPTSYYQPSSRRTSLQGSRPSMQHRSSSQASSHHSRRSSLNSGQYAGGSSAEVVSAPRSVLDGPYVSALNRRPSDPNRVTDRTPLAGGGDLRPRSRPSSVHSVSLHAMAMERKLSRSPTASSAGSIHGRVQASPLQSYHRRVGSGSSTKVMRQLKIVNPPSHVASHMRSRSMASIQSNNSRSSSPSSAVDLPSLNRSGSGSQAGDARSLVRSPELEYQSSDAGRSSSSLGSYGHTVLVAHRPKSALSGGIPHSPYHSRAQHRSHWDRSDLTPKAKVVLRDVFAAKPGDDDGEWVDEDENCYEGGLGQASTRGQNPTGSGAASHGSASSFPGSSSFAMASARGRGGSAPPSSFHAGRPASYASAARPSSSPRLGSSLALDGPSSSSAAAAETSSSAASAAFKDPSSSSVSSAPARRQLPTTGIRSSGIMEEEEPEDE